VIVLDVLNPLPVLDSQVELTDERQRHILNRHPDLLPVHLDYIIETVADPDEIRRDPRFPSTRLFARWFDNLRRGKYVVVAVVSDTGEPERHWVVTAYLAERVRPGITEWKRS
jgi:hypothetical protein